MFNILFDAGGKDLAFREYDDASDVGVIHC